ncbi:glycosyltransferase family 4 protein [Acinetobacter sp. UGAL515B_02]|nr:glycosyltransferase family 4 protein [Acinetobacter sp. UGAL515B_02]WON79866.1 glycosyltransferase family 4 protein [Acinetobacter sp. UGAL515B_02]
MQYSFRMAIVADWLVAYAGAERVISEMLQVFPKSDLFSVIDFLSDESRQHFLGKHAQTTFIQKFPKAETKYRNYLPFMPLAIEQLDVSAYDVILSSSHAVAKGVLTGPDQLHISYVHSPIRYAWDLQHQYLRELGLTQGIKALIVRWLLHKIRMWDYRTANGVDHFVANSKFIARRIKKVYGRDSDVIYPPVDTDRFTLRENKDNFYFTASRMVPYKKIDLIVEAFAQMPDKKLVVIGDGPDMQKIKSKATSNIEILGYQSNQVMQDHMQRAKAFVFAAEEDFGITPVESQACGTPVIAFGKGGSRETVMSNIDQNPTGVFLINKIFLV